MLARDDDGTFYKFGMRPTPIYYEEDVRVESKFFDDYDNLILNSYDVIIDAQPFSRYYKGNRSGFYSTFADMEARKYYYIHTGGYFMLSEQFAQLEASGEYDRETLRRMLRVK